MTDGFFTSTRELNPYVHIFLYGATGASKTTQAALFPEPVIIIPMTDENGAVALQGCDYPMKKVTSAASMLQVVDHLERTQRTKGEDALPGLTLVMDSMTHYCDMVVEEVAQKRGGQMDQQGWGLVASHFRTLQTQVRRLRMHCVWTALAETYSDGQGGNTGGGPMLQGRVKKLLPSSCDIIAYLEEKPGKPPRWKCSTQKTMNGFEARSRFRQMPKEFDVGDTAETSFWSKLEPLLEAMQVEQALIRGQSGGP